MAIKQPVRIITMAWGERYIYKLLSLTLPAVLAPGNLPALIEAFDCEVVLVTEEASFDRIRHSSVFQRLEGYCPVRLVMMDDLIGTPGMYGLSLTLALHRGFADLGEKMTEYYLIFFNADFIVADGSFRSLVRHMAAGERLIHAPSYCVVLEEVVPILCRRVTQKGCVLALPPREMANIALAHRHNTIRAKTVNQRLFHIAYIEQFYWQVDDYTLLGHQMPIALVCMKPERVVTEMRTFWDYGVVSEFCPTTKPCVLDDSDDFMMIELRTRMTAYQQLALGWPSVEQIAATLSAFVTQDQKDMGLHSLVLHSRDLPESTELAKTQLNEFVKSVYQGMPETAVDHQDHKFWVYHYELYQRSRAEFFERHRAAGRQLSTQPLGKRSSYEPPPLRRLSMGTLCRNALRTLYEEGVGRLPNVRRWHPYWPDMKYVTRLLGQALQGGKTKTFLVYSDDPIIARMVESASAMHEKISVDTLMEVDYGSNEPTSLSESEGGNVKFGSVQSEPNHRSAISRNESEFDVCVCELNLGDLRRFRSIYQKIRPRMRRGAKLLVLYRHSALYSRSNLDLELIENAFPIMDQSRIYFAGSWLSYMARRIFLWGIQPYYKNAWMGTVRAASAVVVGAPIALLASYVADLQNPEQQPRTLTSLTMEFVIL